MDLKPSTLVPETTVRLAALALAPIMQEIMREEQLAPIMLSFTVDAHGTPTLNNCVPPSIVEQLIRASRLGLPLRTTLTRKLLAGDIGNEPSDIVAFITEAYIAHVPEGAPSPRGPVSAVPGRREIVLVQLDTLDGAYTAIWPIVERRIEIAAMEFDKAESITESSDADPT